MDGNRIKFLSGDAQVEESAGRRKFSLAMEEKVKEYEKRMLCDSQCPYILPMHFLTEDGTDTVYYDFTGKLQLAEYIRRQTAGTIPARETRKPVCGALDVLSGILGCIKGLEDYLIFPERVSVHPDTVFVGQDNGQAALAFYPCENQEITFQNRILALMDEVSEAYHDAETGQYLGRLKDFILMKNPGLEGMIGILGTMQREVRYIYWNSGSFRKAEEKDAIADDERTPTLKQISGGIKRKPAGKLIAIQAVFLASLAAVFLSGALDIVSLAGLAVIAVASDLWLIRKLRYVK